MERVRGQVTVIDGTLLRPSVAPTVEVRYLDGTLASIYASNSLDAAAAKSNPFTGGADGEWDFYLPNTRVNVTLSGGSPAIATEVASDYQAFDPAGFGASVSSLTGGNSGDFLFRDATVWGGASPTSAGLYGLFAAVSTYTFGLIHGMRGTAAGVPAMASQQTQSGYIHAFYASSGNGGTPTLMGYIDCNGDVMFRGTMVISGNLTVHGSYTVLNTSVLDVEDVFITVANSQTGTPTLDAGLDVERGDSTNARLAWTESVDRWQAGTIGSLNTLALLEVAETVTGAWTFQRVVTVASGGLQVAHVASLATLHVTNASTFAGAVNIAGTVTGAGLGQFGTMLVTGAGSFNVALNVGSTMTAGGHVRSVGSYGWTIGALAASARIEYSRADSSFSALNEGDGYAKFNGASPTSSTHFVTKGYADATYAGIALGDHGGLSGLADDDHTQYALVSGARAFTGPVTGNSGFIAGAAVAGTGGFVPMFALKSTFPAIMFEGSFVGGRRFGIGMDSGGAMDFHDATGAVYSLRMLVTSAGNVGIGKIPTVMLDVASSCVIGGRLGVGAAPAVKAHVNDGTDRNLGITTDATQYGSVGIALGSFNDAFSAYAPLSILGSAIVMTGGNVLVTQTLTTSGKLGGWGHGIVTSAQVITNSYQLALAEQGLVMVHSDASARPLYVPANATVAFPLGTVITVVQGGAGQITVTSGAGVTLLNAGGLKTRTQESVVQLYKQAANTWRVYGDVTP